MMRKRVLLHPERLGDLGRAHALRGEAHQQPEHRKAARMSQGGKGESGAILFHISRLMEMIDRVE